MTDWTQPAGHPRMPPGGAPPPATAPPVTGPPGWPVSSAPAGPPPQRSPYPPTVPHPGGQPFPPVGPPPSVVAPGSPAGPGGPPAPGRRSWPGIAVLVLVVVLTVGLGVQTWQLVSVSGRLDRANDSLAELSQGQAYGSERLDALEDRASELERIAGEVFDSEAVAAGVLPSVFMVTAGPFSGTAFAIGSPSDDGGTNLFTNYHVIEAVWAQGGRQVTLERTNQRYPAEIVDVEPGSDVAWLRTASSFTGLAAADEDVRAGQPIIAVGAPQGLTDTVTSGVVSTPAQELDDGSGPWVQFDAAINPGNSGGPVINSAQQVVGIATAKGRETEGIGFAVPIEVACGLFDIC